MTGRRTTKLALGVAAALAIVLLTAEQGLAETRFGITIGRAGTDRYGDRPAARQDTGREANHRVARDDAHHRQNRQEVRDRFRLETRRQRGRLTPVLAARPAPVCLTPRIVLVRPTPRRLPVVVRPQVVRPRQGGWVIQLNWAR